MRSLVLAAALALPGTALAAPAIGVSFDAGVPSGIGASALIRPLPWLRLSAGGGTNGAGAGVRAGASAALPVFLSPSLSLEGGHFFEGDANPLVATFAQVPSLGGEMLERVSYDWASASLGAELGWQSTFVLFAQAGASYVTGSLGGTQGKIDAHTSFVTGETHFEGFMPSAKLGFVLWFG